ncbi:unnamed protein product [Ilex paraguariensis]|uniref:TF-B3 domain-containing protein n=1 Tax=Ilex paraguariensis TaxID=185542 RepID=A0ABC8UJQ9_9AQUA
MDNAKKKSIICYERNMAMTSDPYDCGEAKSSAMERAQEVQANLPSKFPSLVKSMLPSHVTGGFWLGLPKHFCNQHLPKVDDIVVLMDENEQAYKTKYLVRKNGLSGGWKGFSVAHKLLEGDVLVFQLIEACKFKVYIVRVNGLAEIDGAIGLLTLDAHSQSINIDSKLTDQLEKGRIISETVGEKCPEPLQLDSHQDNIQEKGMIVLDTDCAPAAEQSGNDSDGIGSEVFDGTRFSESIVDFKDLKSIEDFNIIVDGIIINAEIPTHLQVKYYELCCSQNLFLHGHLVQGLNYKLVSGIISETINIADAIKACKLTTSRDDLEIWDETLKAFEALGMAVGFLRTRLNRLFSLSHETGKVIESKRLERMQAEEEMKTLEAKLFNVKVGIQTLDSEIEALKVKGESRELMFREEANSPW